MKYSLILSFLIIYVIGFTSSQITDLTPSVYHYGMGQLPFHLQVEKPEEVKKITFEVTCYQGSCGINNFYKEEVHTTLISSTQEFGRRKIIYTITEMTEAYYFDMVCENNCYYSVVAFLDKGNEYTVEKAYTNVATLPKGGEEKTFTVTKKATENSATYILTLNAINCIPSITLGETTYKDKKFIQYLIEDSTVDFTFKLGVVEMDNQNDFAGELCSVLIDVEENNPEERLFTLTEGSIQSFQLSEATERMNFKYINIIDFITLDIDVLTNEGLTVDLYKKEMTSTPFKTMTIYKKKTLLISEVQGDDLLISVKKATSGTTTVIPFTIVAHVSKGYPTYFNHNQLTYGYMLPNKQLYFYTDVKKGTTGKMIINFKQGGGKVCVRVMPKEEIDENANWMRKIDLAQNCIKEQVDMTGYLQVIQIHTSHTTVCEKGCEVIVELNNKETPRAGQYLDEVTILYHETDDNRANMVPIREDVQGDTTNVLVGKQDFTLTIPVDTSKLLVQYKSNVFRMFMNFDKETLPTENDYDMKMINNGYYEVNAADIGKTSFNNVKMNVDFFSSTITENYNNYYFKVMPQYKDTPNIIYASSTKIEVCNIKTAGESCYYMVPVKEYEAITSLFISSVNSQSENEKVNIYASLYPADTIDKIDYSSTALNDLLPTKEKSTFQGDRSILIPEDKIEKGQDIYALIQVVPENPGKILFGVSVNINVDNTMTHYITNPKLYYLPKGTTLNLSAFLYGNQSVEFKTVFGVGTVTPSDKSNSVVIEGYGLKNIVVKSTEDQDFGVMAMLYEKEKEEFGKIDYNVLNSISHNTFPYRLYIPITDADVLKEQKQIEIQVKLHDIEYQTQVTNNDNFLISSNIVNENFIKVYDYDRTIVPETAAVDAKFFIVEKMGVSKFKADPKYPFIFLKIDKHPDNKNEYTKIIFDVIVNTKNEKPPSYSLPQGKFYTNVIEGTDEIKKIIYKLTKKENTDTIFDISLALNDLGKKYDFVYETFQDTPTFKNETELLKSETILNGLKNIRLNVPKEETQSILLSIIPVTPAYNDGDKTEVLIKYQTVKEESALPSFPYDREINTKVTKEKGLIAFSTNNIIKGKENVKNAKYIIRIYKKSDVPETTLINDIFMNYDTEAKTINPIEQDIKEIDNTNDTFEYVFNYTEFGTEFYATVATTFITVDGSEYKFGFDVKYENIQDVPPSSGGFDFWLLGILFIALLVIGIIAAGIIFLWRKEKEKKAQIDLGTTDPLV